MAGLDGSAGKGGTEQCSAHPQPLNPLLMVELRDHHSRYCPSCFSTSFFCSKLLNILKMYLISIFHACGTGDEVLDRLTSQVPEECMFPALTGNLCTMIFKGPQIFTCCTWSTSYVFWREGPKHFLKKAVSGTPKLVSHSFFFLVTFENLEFKKKNNVTQIFRCHNRLLTVKQCNSNDIHSAAFPLSQSWTGSFSKKPITLAASYQNCISPLSPLVQLQVTKLIILPYSLKAENCTHITFTPKRNFYKSSWLGLSRSTHLCSDPGGTWIGTIQFVIMKWELGGITGCMWNKNTSPLQSLLSWEHRK